jgi:hypothetical protein
MVYEVSAKKDISEKDLQLPNQLSKLNYKIFKIKLHFVTFE